MGMTRKDFQLIADCIHMYLPRAEREFFAEKMATALNKSNNHFDRVRFIKACVGDSDQK